MKGGRKRCRDILGSDHVWVELPIFFQSSSNGFCYGHQGINDLKLQIPWLRRYLPSIKEVAYMYELLRD